MFPFVSRFILTIPTTLMVKKSAKNDWSFLSILPYGGDKQALMAPEYWEALE